MKRLLSIILGLAAIGFIASVMVRSFSWQDAYASVRNLHWSFFVIVVAFCVAISLLKATRFSTILHFDGIRASWFRIVHTFMSSQAFTPFPAGEIGRAILFRNKLDIDIDRVIAPVLLQALLELWTAACWVLGVALFVGSSRSVSLVGIVILMVVLSLPLLIPLKLHALLTFFKNKGLAYAWVDHLLDALHALSRLFVKRTRASRWRFWISIVSLALASHALEGGLLWYIARTEGANLSFLQSAFSVSTAALIQGILTIIPGGLGVTEGGLVAVLTSFRVAWNQSVLITLLYRIVMLPLTIVIALAFFFPLHVPKLVLARKNP